MSVGSRALSAGILACVFSALFCWSSPQTKTAGDKHDSGTDMEITAMIARYAESVDRADTELASQIWLDSPEASFIHPKGYDYGFERIKQHVYVELMGGSFTERSLKPRDILVHVYGDIAWAEFNWDFTAKLRKDGSPFASHGRETQIYRKVNGSWRLVHVHYSAMPIS